MASGPTNLLMFFLMKESNHSTILEKKAKRLRKQLGRNNLHSYLEMRFPPREVLARSIVRPMKVGSTSFSSMRQLADRTSSCSGHLSHFSFLCTLVSYMAPYVSRIGVSFRCLS
jgi:hypothetical protein